ncbi:MAG TPA: citrate (Si)-synthase [Saprospiraceae bacterium]|mgnify:CR=1 FL=1|nr:citrate (Si)-synthase [Saprospiraceae bacterium]
MDILKEKFANKSGEVRSEVLSLLKKHGEMKLGEVTISQVFGGMRGIKGLIWDPSELDPEEGIRFRGYSIPYLREHLPRVHGGKEPLPEGLFWLMMTGDVPAKEEVDWLSGEWRKRAVVPEHTFRVLDALSADTHPMTQFSAAVLAMQSDSIFAARYAEGMSKNDYWDVMYEDAMNLIARLPIVAAYIYRRCFHDHHHIPADPSLDWSGNFAHMLGINHPDFKSLMRLYMTIHADHEGGNASAHTVHLVGSTLSDAYYSFSAGMNALAGPLHGLANQEVIKWIFEMVESLGTTKPDNDQISQYIHDTLQAGKVIPGYGHAVLRIPDPRFTAQKIFAEQNIAEDDYIKIVWQLFDIVPGILQGLGKVKNPWPNVDAHSGALLVHYGLNEYSYYTVLFGVSRALGVMAGLCWARAMGFPLERPKSLTTNWVKQFISAHA